MATFGQPTQTQSRPPINRGNQFGSEAGENQSKEDSSQNTQKVNADSYGSWNSFLAPSEIRMERLDTTAQSIPTAVSLDLPQVEEKIPTFEEIYAKITGTVIETQNTPTQKGSVEIPVERDIVSESSIVEEKKVSRVEGSLYFNKSVTETIVVQNGMEDTSGFQDIGKETNSSSQKKESNLLNKEKLLGGAESVANATGKIAKFGLKEGTFVAGALKDLWKTYIYIKEKKPDPKAKENAEKAAKRKANKQRFIALLREGISIYYSEMRKALIELEAKLGVNVLRTEDKNRLLGRYRNTSFEGNDSVYAIHQTAFAMMEQKKQQQTQSSRPSAGRGKASRGQIFTDKTLQGERSGGNNMMSAVG